jgi:hypothetical protein
MRETTMNRSMGGLLRILLAALLLWPAGARSQVREGHVQIPLDVYENLLRGSRSGGALPAGYAFQAATAQVAVSVLDERPRASVTVELGVQILQSEWTLVPMVPSGTRVTAATVGGVPMSLLPTPSGLMWATNVAGTFQLRLTYETEATPSDDGHTLALPLPTAPTTQLTAVFPATGLDVAVIPGARVTTTEAGSQTLVTASLAGFGGAQITWRSGPVSAGPTVSRAWYRGEVVEQSARWTAEYRVELASDAPATVDLLHTDVALVSLLVDGEEAPVVVRGDAFGVVLRGRGAHSVLAEFEVSVSGAQGQPRVALRVPRVPVSRFELVLPGQKDVSVEPAASVASAVEDGRTVAVVHLPMTDRVAFSWLEAVPVPDAEELVANASIYHAAWAEEGVLTVRATLQYEITRGEASQFALTAPGAAQINRISSPEGAVVDWRVTDLDGERILTVFLDRRVSGGFRFDVAYELLLGSTGAMAAELELPLLHARDVNRQRGMVALLSNRELTLEPVRESSLTRVGENQLPAFVREGITMTVAHTFRYFEGRPSLAVRPQAPERRQARFDARVDTLVSLGDVTTTGAATIEIQVKSGTMMALELYLPGGVNVLTLAAPSLRDYRVEPIETGEQRIAVEFTQEMEGQFRVEVTYERINVDDDAQIAVPLLRVADAEVEQGRIALEALSAVEVRPAAVEHLSTVEFTELPQQLILRTTNPILLAFRYVQAEPRPYLALRVTRHREIEVQAAIIDLAHYRTLVTRDGFAVTTARFTVRNSRQQFLRVRLPAGSEVWSAAVAGEAETPALANGGDERTGPEVLINIINSAQGFPVELVYVTQLDALGVLGAFHAELPQPDMVVTRTRWDLDLPDDLRYGKPSGDLDVVAEAVPLYGDSARYAQPQSGAALVTRPVGIAVPESGVRFSFEKLYASQAAAPAAVRIPYSSTGGAGVGVLLSALGALLFWLGLLGLLRRPRPVATLWLALAVVVGAAMVLAPVMLLDTALDWPLGLSLVVVVGAALVVVGRRGGRWYRTQKERVEARRQQKSGGDQGGDPGGDQGRDGGDAPGD